MSPRRIYLLGRASRVGIALRFEAISALRASMVCVYTRGIESCFARLECEMEVSTGRKRRALVGRRGCCRERARSLLTFRQFPAVRYTSAQLPSLSLPPPCLRISLGAPARFLAHSPSSPRPLPQQIRSADRRLRRYVFARSAVRPLSLNHPACSSFPEHEPDEALVGIFLGVRGAPYTAHHSPPRSFQNYTDYFKCVAAKGDDFAPCKQFKRAYNSLCPSTCTRLIFSF